MVADRVDIYSWSQRQDAAPVKWTCDGSPNYEMGAISEDDFKALGRAEDQLHGTDIVLHIGEDGEEFMRTPASGHPREVLQVHARPRRSAARHHSGGRSQRRKGRRRQREEGSVEVPARDQRDRSHLAQVTRRPQGRRTTWSSTGRSTR